MVGVAQTAWDSERLGLTTLSRNCRDSCSASIDLGTYSKSVVLKNRFTKAPSFCGVCCRWSASTDWWEKS